MPPKVTKGDREDQGGSTRKLPHIRPNSRPPRRNFPWAPVGGDIFSTGFLYDLPPTSHGELSACILIPLEPIGSGAQASF
ncbi:MAG: hypothetical protein HWN65_14420 [Candidatus Helarchaeota archaeon]|nr:hypothetical protein [Candidatus Helarchaeota archaeon]